MQRLDWVDQIKGFAIFLMVYAHNFPITEKYIYTFHMPLFLIVSGFFLPKKGSISAVKKRFNTIIIPYFIWAFLLFIFWVVIAKDVGTSSEKNLSITKNFIGIFFAQGGMEYMDWGIPMWFLPMIFVSFCIVLLLKQISNNKWIQLAISLLLLCLGCGITSSLPWSINVACVSSFFILLGNLIFEALQIIKLKKTTLLLLAIVLLLVHFFLYNYNLKIDMYRSIYGNVLLFVTTAILGSLAFIVLFKLFPVFKPLSEIGKYTIVILALQIIALAFIKLVLLAVFNYANFNFNEYEKFIIAIAQIVLMLPAFKIINHYIPILNGGRKN